MLPCLGQAPRAPRRRVEVDDFGGNFGRSAGWDWGQGGRDWVFEVSFGVLTHTVTIPAQLHKVLLTVFEICLRLCRLISAVLICMGALFADCVALVGAALPNYALWAAAEAAKASPTTVGRGRHTTAVAETAETAKKQRASRARARVFCR